MAKPKKTKRSAPSAMTPDALSELDKDTLISLLIKMHEQYAQLTEVVQTMVREKHGTKTERFVDSAQLNLFANEEEADEHPNQPGAESKNATKSRSIRQKRRIRVTDKS